jgi:hypothetical protein
MISFLLVAVLASVLALPSDVFGSSSKLYSGHTAQRCAAWATFCSPKGSLLPITFRVTNGAVTSLVVGDEGSCNTRGHSQVVIAPGPGRVDRHGRFHLTYTRDHGALESEITGTIAGGTASGQLSATEHINPATRGLDPHGSVVCTSKHVHWTARSA